MCNDKKIRVLFIGDIFGKPGIQCVEEHLDLVKSKYNIDFTIAQAENVSGRKGFVKKDYKKLKSIGIDVFTLGNHVWAKDDIHSIIDNDDVIRPLNINNTYRGHGTQVFDVKGVTLRVTSIMGIAFNRLLSPWKEEYANSFFDAIDKVLLTNESDLHFIDFHAETTSEKSVLSLYLDGKVNALIGTHTHVQTNDARTLPLGTAFLTDVGMTGPANSAVGANYNEVYEKMRNNSDLRFRVSSNPSQFNAVVLELSTRENKVISLLNIQPEKK
ncbi:conserved hypothetical protein [Mycoplasmopsis pulmonis]|uniref:Metallophosphoesterase n=1 Tax=Mycoplasmopsis pulmonis (strain UAB CTIP) TaxID=272635 RepID=Q98PP8_MYCPU|nr:YmdB family metallophosphoesterase [Mycoplasmopsis pulmonis]MDZ7293691.1 YmdB family metallophosphoesterase [Mycoplasmopsis pulmonis]CAC13844.1 conserved hypothetical protein [Mycoplasmopsis pulmonis]VEU68438.1 putative metallophosphoesterase [Mycoplasmopsis pulmonis]